MIRAIGLVLLAGLTAPASAQPNQPEAQASERHLRISEGEAGDRGVTLDGTLTYRRAGNRPPELSLDLCFPVRPELTSIDRLTAPVSVSRNRMTATGRSLVTGTPTTVTIETAPGRDKGPPTFKGQIAYGDQTITIREERLDYEDGPAPEPYQGGIVGSLAPNEVMATVPLASVRTVLDIARRQKAILPPNQLVPGCTDLRLGKQVIRLLSGAGSVKALASALKAVSGSEVAEPGDYSREDSVRLPASFRGTPDIRIVQDFAETARAVLGAPQAATIRSRPETGDHVILVARDTALAKPLGLREVVVITVAVAPEAGGDKKEPVLFLMRIGAGFVDPSDALTLQQDLTESMSYTDLIPGRVSAALAEAYAAKLGTEARQGSGPR